MQPFKINISWVKLIFFKYDTKILQNNFLYVKEKQIQKKRLESHMPTS